MSAPASSINEKNELEHVEAGNKGAYRPDDASEQDAEIEPELHLKTYLVVVAAVVGYLAGVIFLSGCGFWASAITAEVGGADQVLWVQQAYNPPVALLAAPLARIGDQVGRRWLWIIANTLAMVGCILVATTHTVGQAIAGVAIFGIAFANSGNIFAVPAEVLPRRHRGTAAMAVSLGGYGGSFIGVLGGASLISTNPGGYSGWRTLFWIITAAHAFSTVLVVFCYHPPLPPNPENRSLVVRIMDFDAAGTLLLAFALVPLLVGLISGGNTAPWSSPKVIAPLVVGCVFFVLFGLHQRFFKKDGLLHHGMFVSRNAGLCLFAIAVEGFVYNAFNNFYGEETGVLFDPRPVYLGLRFAVFGLCAVFATPFYMYAAYRWRLLNQQLSLGFVLFLIGIIGMATVKPGSGKIILLWVAICGVGFASPISCLLSVAQLCMPSHFAGQISGLMICSRSVGGSIGPAICSAVFVSKITKALPSFIGSAAVKAGVPAASLVAFITAVAGGDAAAAAKVEGVTPAMVGAGFVAWKAAYAASFKYIWIVIAPFVLVSLGCCLVMVDSAKEMTFLVDAPVEEIHHKHHHIDATH